VSLTALDPFSQRDPGEELDRKRCENRQLPLNLAPTNDETDFEDEDCTDQQVRCEEQACEQQYGMFRRSGAHFNVVTRKMVGRQRGADRPPRGSIVSFEPGWQLQAHAEERDGVTTDGSVSTSLFQSPATL